jgi:hypothetical protein
MRRLHVRRLRMQYATYAIRGHVCVGYVCNTPYASVLFHLSHRLLMTYCGSLFGAEALMTHAIKKKINDIRSKRGNSSNGHVTLYASFNRPL